MYTLHFFLCTLYINIFNRQIGMPEHVLFGILVVIEVAPGKEEENI